MATISSILVPAKNVRSLETGVYDITLRPVLPATPNGDSVQLFVMPHDVRAISAHLRVPNNLGAGATLRLQRNRAGVRADLTASTTAATAGVAGSAAFLPVDLLAGDIVEILVSGAAVAANIAGVEVDVLVQHA